MRRILAAVLLFGCVTGCGRDGTTPTEDEFDLLLAITPPSRTVAVGDSADFTLLIAPETAAQASVPIVCTASDASVASTRALPTGCRARAIKSGQAVITASKGSKAASALFVVTAPATDPR